MNKIILKLKSVLNLVKCHNYSLKKPEVALREKFVSNLQKDKRIASLQDPLRTKLGR